MARRIAAAGAERMPLLEEGLRLGWAHLADGHPAMRSTLIEALDRREPFSLCGGQVWSGLYQVDPDAADRFRRRCGWQPGATSAWLRVDQTRWDFDPRAALLTPAAD